MVTNRTPTYLTPQQIYSGAPLVPFVPARSLVRQARKEARDAAKKLATLAAIPGLRVFENDHQARAAELPRLVVKTPSGSALRICWPPRRRRAAR